MIGKLSTLFFLMFLWPCKQAPPLVCDGIAGGWSNLEDGYCSSRHITKCGSHETLQETFLTILQPNPKWSSFFIRQKRFTLSMSIPNSWFFTTWKYPLGKILPDSIPQFLVTCLGHQSLQLVLGNYAHWWDRALESWVHIVDDSSKSYATDSWHKWIRPKQQKRKQCKRPSTHLWPGIQKAKLESSN